MTSATRRPTRRPLARFEASMRTRAESRSLVAPPTRSSSARGTAPAARTAPRVRGDPVRVRTSQAMAISWTRSPSMETVSPAHTQRKAPDCSNRITAGRRLEQAAPLGGAFRQHPVRIVRGDRGAHVVEVRALFLVQRHLGRPKVVAQLFNPAGAED